MQPGNSFVAGYAYWAGNPTSVAISEFNAPPGTVVLDYSTPALWLKTSALGDNSGFLLLQTGDGSGNVSIAGSLTLQAALIGSIQLLSGAGAVNTTTLTTKLTTTGGSQPLTLANGTNGQFKAIVHAVDGGSAILTPTTATGFTTITFTNAGDSCLLQYFTTQGWMLVGTPTATAA